MVKIWPLHLVRFTAYYFLLVACPSFGQALQKKNLAEAEYKLWGYMVNQRLSASGQWSSYSVTYEKTDTLFVKNTGTGKTYSYAKSYDGEFGGDSWFACQSNDTLSLQNLKSGRVTYIPQISQFSFSGDGKFLVLFSSDSDGIKSLIIKDAAGQIQASAIGITEWKWNEKKDALAFVSKSGTLQSVQVFRFGPRIEKETVTTSAEGSFKNFAWQRHFLAFMQENRGKGSLYLYDCRKIKLNRFVPELCDNFPADMKISSAYGAIKIAFDGSRVTFNLKEPTLAANDEIVQVWNGNDKQLYPSLKKYGDFRLYDKFAVWFPVGNRFLQLSNRNEYVAILGPKGNYAVVYDPMAYEPYTDAYGLRDVYLLNLTTGKRNLLLKRFSGHSGTLQLSPDGKYVSYVKEKNWWVFDIFSGKHCNVTKALDVPVYNVDFDYAGEGEMYGIAGWSPSDKSLFIYDQFDIWEIMPDGSKSKLLTQGRSDKITFRIENFNPVKNGIDDGVTIINTAIEKRLPILLKAQNKSTGYGGYYRLKTNSELLQLVWDRKRFDLLINASADNSFSYVSESFENPPSLMLYRNAEHRQIYQSNEQHYKYKWGHAERITYSVDGKELAGILIFPADFHKEKQYPMIVSVYERQSSTRHEYINPSFYNEGGINKTNLSAKGYFVLFPDIAYAMRDMGDSAVKCALAATDAVLAQYNVDPNRVGLTGHSFGGYETDFIITKTNRFAAALSGSAISDLVSHYLHIGGNGKANFFRYEHQQQRMERSLFEDRESYFRNSPILQAEGVKTPLLAWTGDADDNVHPFQSIEFYLALRRLGKEQVLLVYPGEGHSLSNKENQADLTQRFEAWFEKYLKP